MQFSSSLSLFLMLESCKKSNSQETNVSGVLEQFLRRTLEIREILQNMSIFPNDALFAEKMQASLRNAEIRGLSLEKNPNQIPKKQTIEISREK